MRKVIGSRLTHKLNRFLSNQELIPNRSGESSTTSLTPEPMSANQQESSIMSLLQEQQVIFWLLASNIHI